RANLFQIPLTFTRDKKSFLTGGKTNSNEHTAFGISNATDGYVIIRGKHCNFLCAGRETRFVRKDWCRPAHNHLMHSIHVDIMQVRAEYYNRNDSYD